MKKKTVLVIEIKPPEPPKPDYVVLLENELGGGPSELFRGPERNIAYKWYSTTQRAMVVGDTLIMYYNGRIVKKEEKDR